MQLLAFVGLVERLVFFLVGAASADLSASCSLGLPSNDLLPPPVLLYF